MSQQQVADPSDPRNLHQHRCHPRLADFVATFSPQRLTVLVRCYASKPGEEPSDPPTLHAPSYYVPQLRSSGPASSK